MSKEQPRRHAIEFSDREVALLERAVLCYAAVMRIQTGTPARQESDDNARVAAMIQSHQRCACPGSRRLKLYARPIEDRPVIGPEDLKGD